MKDFYSHLYQQILVGVYCPFIFLTYPDIYLQIHKSVHLMGMVKHNVYSILGYYLTATAASYPPYHYTLDKCEASNQGKLF